MSNVKNQHYVPQFYLKYFTNQQEKLCRFDKIEKKRLLFTNVKNLACEKYFYDFPQQSGTKERQQPMEKWFSELETKASKFMNHIQKKIQGILSLKPSEKVDSLQGLTQDQKLDLAYWVAVQSLRTNYFRDFSNEFWQKTQPLIPNIVEEVEDELSRRRNKFEEDNSLKVDESLANEIKKDRLNQCMSTLSYLENDGMPITQAKFIFEHCKELAEILLNHIWLIGVNSTDQLFFTSDNPVVMAPHLESSGYSSEGIEVVFPINSKLILIMLEKKYFRHNLNLERTLVPLTREYVLDYNRLQVLQSSRFIYSESDDFALVEEICNTNPDVCSNNRERLQLKLNSPPK